MCIIFLKIFIKALNKDQSKYSNKKLIQVLENEVVERGNSGEGGGVATLTVVSSNK